VEAAKAAAVLFDAGESAYALLAGENGLLHCDSVFGAQYFVFALEESAQLTQQGCLFGEHLCKVFAADVPVQGIGVHDGYSASDSASG
jgi:hypothetical protein